METLFDETLRKLQAAIHSEGSIRKVAEKLDLNPSTVSRWFSEGRSPDFRALTVLLEHFGVRIVFPGDRPLTASEQTLRELEAQIQDLKEKLVDSERLRVYYQAKMDGAIEVMRALKETAPESTASPRKSGEAEENSSVA